MQVLNCRIEVTESEDRVKLTLSTEVRTVWSITVLIQPDVPEDMRREVAYDMAMKEFGDYLMKLEPKEPDKGPIMHHWV